MADFDEALAERLARKHALANAVQHGSATPAWLQGTPTAKAVSQTSP